MVFSDFHGNRHHFFTSAKLSPVCSAILGARLLIETRKPTKRKGITMNSRWQTSAQDTAEALRTPMPWTRGAMRKAMIQRRQMHDEETTRSDMLEQQSA
jgi:hypothetical protein